jgi:hypothetical protein
MSAAPVRPLVAFQPTTSLASSPVNAHNRLAPSGETAAAFAPSSKPPVRLVRSDATALPRFSEAALSPNNLPRSQVNLANGLRNRVMNPNFVEYRLDLLPLLTKGSGRTWRELWRHPWDPKAVSPVYVSYVANH